MQPSASSARVTPNEIQSYFEQAISLSLHLWPALSLAVQNNWGGPESADKRDWFAGAVSDLFPDLSANPAALSALQLSFSSKPITASPSSHADGAAAMQEPDVGILEEMLLQVMLDEFEVVVEDESALEVAEQIVQLRWQCAKGNLAEVDKLARRYHASKGDKVVFARQKDQEEEDGSDWKDESDDDEGEEKGNDDVEMDEAPPVLFSTRKKPAPEVDEDGFTKVVRRKK